MHISNSSLPYVWMEGDEARVEERVAKMYQELVHSMNLPLFSRSIPKIPLPSAIEDY